MTFLLVAGKRDGMRSLPLLSMDAAGPKSATTIPNAALPGKEEEGAGND
jgi:hypothetical protein